MEETSMLDHDHLEVGESKTEKVDYLTLDIRNQIFVPLLEQLPTAFTRESVPNVHRGSLEHYSLI